MSQLVHSAEYLFAALRIQLGSGFVQHDNVRLHHQNAGDCHTLHLTSRQVKGIAIPELPDVQQLQGIFGAAVHFGPGNAQVLHAEGHFLIDVVLGARQLVEGVLEHQTHLTAKLGNGGAFGGQAVDQHPTTVGAVIELGNQTDQRLAQRAFSGSIRSHDTNEFAFFHREGQTVQCQRVGMGITVFKIFHSNHRHWAILHPAASTIRASKAIVIGLSPR